MTDTPATTPEKISAEIRKLAAEALEIEANVSRTARIADAEVAKLQAEADKVRIDVRNASLVTEQYEMSLETAKRDRARLHSHDYYHQVYRFLDSVDEHSVTTCMDTLTTWHRLFPGCDIEIVFSSPGGSVFDGFALFDFIQTLRRDGHKVTTGTLGYAASMAGILLQAGDVRYMGSNAAILIHEISSLAYGKSSSIEDALEFLKKLQERAIAIFVERSGGKITEDTIRDGWKRKDWWLTSSEALALGLVDEVR